MAITFGVHASAGSSNSTSATTPARTTTPGSAIVVAAQNYSGGAAVAPTISDNKGNTYTLIGLAGGMSATPAQTETLALFYCENIAGGTGHTLTVTGPYYPSITFVELLGNTVKFDTGKSAFGMDDASPFTVGPITPSANGAAILSGLVPKSAGSGAHTLAAPGSTIEDITDVNSFFLLALGGFVQPTAAAYSPSWTVADGSTQNAVGVAAFIETGGGATAYTLAANGGNYALTGVAASLIYTAPRVLTAAGGAFALAGSAVDLTHFIPRRLAADAGAFAWSGIAAALQYTSRAPTLGGHTMAYDYDNFGTDPRTTDPITTQNGSTLLVLVGVDNPNDSQPTDNYGNEFERAAPRINYNLWPGYGVSAWVATNIAGGSGHTVTVQKDAFPAGEISIYVAEVRGAGNIVGGMSEKLTPDDLVSAPVTTNAPALMLASWWGDNTIGPHTAVARNGYTPLESILIQGSIIQSAAAYKVEPAAGTYTVGWDETPQQGALLGLFAFEAADTSFASGTFALTGAPAALRIDRRMQADARNVTLAGAAATLTTHYMLAADAGSFAATGQDATVLANRALAAASGSIAVAGQDATLLHVAAGAYAMAANTGAYSWTGEPIDVIRDRQIAAASGELGVVGASATLLYSGAVVVVSSPMEIGVPTAISALHVPAAVNNIKVPR